MPILDDLILAADVRIVPVAKLSPALRRQLGARRGDSAVTRLRGRAPAKLVSRFGASLLNEFTEAKPVSAAVIACAARHGLDPSALLAEAFPLLRDCFNSRFLAVAGSPEASRTLPSRDRGDAVGRYTVLRCLQVLDDTELYQARAPDGGMVAIKLARPGVTSGRLFGREAAALRHLGGNGTPTLLGRGRHHGRPWLAMSWCEGIAPEFVFAELRERDDAASHRRLLGLVKRIAGRYAWLHRMGVLHGDVHLRNILIGRRDEVWLVDFGLARSLPPLRLGGQAGAGGVPQLFAPEQAAVLLAGRDVPAPTRESEQYALAAVLYCLVTGALPLELSLDQRTMLQQIIEDPPLPFARRGAQPWPSLESVLMQALAKDPARRHHSAAALHRALSQVGPARRPKGSEPVRPDRDSLDEMIAAFLGRVDYGSKAFNEPGPPPTCSLMLGRTGVAYALYRLACLRDDARLLALADGWLSRIEADVELPTAFASPGEGLDPAGVGPISPFHSITGVHFTRALLALAMNDTWSASRAVGRFAAVSRTAWHKRDLTLGRAGVPLAGAQLIEALVALPEQAMPVRAVAQDVVDELWAESDGAGPIGGDPTGEDFSAAHGWAGLLHATLRWHGATGAPLPVAMLRRLQELAARAESLGRGVHWPQVAAGPAASVWASHQVAGWCNGPAGFVPLWTLADIHFPRSGFLALAEASAQSTWEAPSQFFDLCCGLVGRAFALLSLYRHTGRDEWLERAWTLTRRADQQFRNARPSLHRPYSLFKGEAGLALLAADLQHPETGAFPLVEPEGFAGPAAHG